MSARVAERGARRRQGWRRDPEGRRERVLQAAVRAFSRKGFAAARVQDIARAAGVAEGTVFHQFGSKQGLLVAVGERYGQGMARAAFGGVGADIQPGQASVVVHNIFEYVRKTEGSLAAFLLTNDPAEGGPAQDANRRQMLAAIEAMLERWMERGLIRPVDPRVSAAIQFGLVENALRDCFLREKGEREEEYVREVTACLTGYLSPTSD
ncbi:MAG: TetR/AcrR family transcriptional regulator [Deltaproteobacteria bacterium]|nr:TetR/AcrR family transcriptional regulator [Deltaproteobacteria bacterium]